MKRALLACWIGALLPIATAIAQDSPSRQSASWGIMVGADLEYWSFGLTGGVGFEVGDATHALFLEARYMRMGAGGLVPVTLGVRF